MTDLKVGELQSDVTNSSCSVNVWDIWKPGSKVLHKIVFRFLSVDLDQCMVFTLLFCTLNFFL